MCATLYRLNVIDASGRVVDVYEPECMSDEEAYHRASALVGGAYGKETAGSPGLTARTPTA